MTGPLRGDLGRIAPYLRPHGRALLGAMALAGVISACQGTIVVLVREVLDSLLAAGDARAAWLLPAAVVGLFAVQGGARVGRTYLTRRAALRAESALRRELFAHFLGRDPASLQGDGVGDSIARLGHDAGKIRTAVGAAVTIVQRPLSALAIGGAALLMAPKLALLAAVALPAVAVVITWSGRRTRTTSRAHADALGTLLADADDALRGLRTLQAAGAEEAARGRFAEDDDRQVGAALRATLFRVAGPPGVELAAAAGIAAVIALGTVQVRAEQLTPGALVAFLVALGLLNEPLKGIAQATALVQEARGGLARVFEALDRPSGEPDAPGARPLVAARDPGGAQGGSSDVSSAAAFDASARGGGTPRARGVALELEGVVVERGGRRVLDGVSLTVGPGDVVVIEGPSGAGKSTLLDAIAGFAAPSAGTIRWNGTDARELTLASRRAHLALVDQAPWLGGGTIREAIALGRADAGDAEVAAAADAAGLELGLDVVVGDGGRPVSGGERQRIALARALLRDTPVLLLDEPTANLDAASEAAFLATLAAIAADRTVLVVSHRPGPRAIATASSSLSAGVLAPRTPAVPPSSTSSDAPAALRPPAVTPDDTADAPDPACR